MSYTYALQKYHLEKVACMSCVFISLSTSISRGVHFCVVTFGEKKGGSRNSHFTTDQKKRSLWNTHEASTKFAERGPAEVCNAKRKLRGDFSIIQRTVYTTFTAMCLWVTIAGEIHASLPTYIFCQRGLPYCENSASLARLGGIIQFPTSLYPLMFLTTQI